MLLKLVKSKPLICALGAFRSVRTGRPQLKLLFASGRSQPVKYLKPIVSHPIEIVERGCSSSGSLGKVDFESVCAETLDSLSEYFEELIETEPQFKNGDVIYSDGVLTVHLGSSYGTYVINRQSPNLQIWLSSPKSGPKRYDFVDGTWTYKHDSSTLHSLLENEIQDIVKKKIELTKRCVHSHSENA